MGRRNIDIARVLAAMTAIMFFGVWSCVTLFGDTSEITLPGGVKMSFVQIPSGTYQIGNLADQHDKRIHTVTKKKTLLMGTYEVTQEQYKSIAGVNPSYFIASQTDYSSGYSNTASQPAEQVSWFDAVRFCNALSINQGFAPCYSSQSNTSPITDDDILICNWNANGYRLPTDGEWEAACRASGTAVFYWGDDTSEATIKQNAWYEMNCMPGSWTAPHAAKGGTQPVGTKLPNRFGLYDMSGNVLEWCWDMPEPVVAPGRREGSGGVCRGGSWSNSADRCSSSLRTWYPPVLHLRNVGFRLLRTP
ncbi:MAG: formylglycine-generating enzyme family protein [Candidatus Riflebacteria bacterium]|nr:formylglycine-generating enzyme family protein [Candidatus Riflebacteria bacterium]